MDRSQGKRPPLGHVARDGNERHVASVTDTMAAFLRPVASSATRKASER
jgi:hypothetical protein